MMICGYSWLPVFRAQKEDISSPSWDVAHCCGGVCECKKRWEDSSPLCLLQFGGSSGLFALMVPTRATFFLRSSWASGRSWTYLSHKLRKAESLSSLCRRVRVNQSSNRRLALITWNRLWDMVALKTGLPFWSSHRLRVDSPLDRYTPASMRSPMYALISVSSTSLHPDTESAGSCQEWRKGQKKMPHISCRSCSFSAHYEMTPQPNCTFIFGLAAR